MTGISNKFLKDVRLKVIIVLAIIGSLYGSISAVCNQNPYYSPKGELLVSQTELHLAWHWEPSPIWLPSYLLCKVPRNGFGIRHTRSGYLFDSQFERVLYFAGSTILGSLISVALGIGVSKFRTLLFKRGNKKC
jgi:hypothetical protein